MQLQWDRTQIPAMGTLVQGVQNQEQTLEVRLGEDMPDIGYIICGWGQPLLRGKEWHADGIGVSGGIMVWILYGPEDGSAPRCVEGWLPFQLKWNLPPTERDGTICCDIRLRGVDARVLSARKMMLRAQISALGEALVPTEVEYVSCGETPQHIQLDKRTYPVLLRAEAGEVAIVVDEDIPVPGVRPMKIISCTLESKLTEQKVVGSRVIFRGECSIHLNYFGEEGEIHSCDLRAPFAQYAQLDRDYDKQTAVEALIAVSSLEPELTEEGLRLKCTLVCQYKILEQHRIEAVQDAYSTKHEIELTLHSATIPTVLDQRTERRSIQQTGPGEMGQIIDTCLYMEQPVMRRNGNNVDMLLPGSVQVLSRDANGAYHGNTIRFADQWSLYAEDHTALQWIAAAMDRPRALSGGEGIEVQCDLELQLCATAYQTIPQIGEIRVGQEKQMSRERPSMILRRPGDASLWELAKQYGSTVEQIRQANGLEDGIPKDKMLLIPIA